MVYKLMIMNDYHRKASTFLVYIVLVSITLVTVIRTLPPSALPADVPANEFSAQRAIRHIEIIAQNPHPAGSAANETVRGYILTELKNLGLETETQRDGELENVMGRIIGMDSSDAVLLTAHLDSVAQSFGATDDGSGVAVLLETVRALMLEAPFRNTIIFLFTDDEESGLVGAEAFIAHHPWANDVKVVIGFDAGGLSGPGVLSTTSLNNGWLIRQLAQADSYFTGSSAISALADSGTDFGHAFKPAGFSGYAFDLYWDRRIHTPEDNLENVSLASIQQQGYHALSLARHFANLDSLNDPKEADAIYFSVLRFFTVVYPSTWAIPLAILVTVIFIGVLAFGLRQKILAWGGMGFGFFALLMSLIIAPLPGLLLDRSMPGIPVRFIGRAFDRPPQVGGVALVAFLLIVIWYFLAQKMRRTNLFDLTMGALLFMFVGMVGTSIFFPALSFLFTLPLLVCLLAFANNLYWSIRQKDSLAVIAGFLLSGTVTIVVDGPTIMLGLFDQMALTLPLLGILCGFLIPQIFLIPPLSRTVEK